MDRLEEITQKLNDLNAQANDIAEAAKADSTKIADFNQFMADAKPAIEQLQQQRQEEIRAVEMKSMQTELTTLNKVIEDLRKPTAEFTLGGYENVRNQSDLPSEDPYAEGHSVFADIRLANKGNNEARERLIHGFRPEDLNPEGKAGKAMTEGTNAQGGYLVRPQVERQIVEARELDNVLRQLCSKINVNTNAIQLDQLGITTTAGWVAELATKPETTGVTLATVTASVFTAAGLATISNQLLQDSDPSVDTLATADLAKRIVALEETAFLNGSGSGQPLGILNTPGIGATALTSTTVADLLDAILDAVADVETDHGMPTAILMHPRTWTRILKSKDAQGAYLISPGSGPQDPRTGLRGPDRSLWGYRVVLSNRIPTNLGSGVNESRVIVGDFSEALILDRMGITVDESPHVYFTTNQTVFRVEERVGFTAARTPAAFNVVGGVGLANG